MDNDRRKELREQYKNRHPKMGVVSWRSGERIWAGTSTDTNADHNGMSFQLKLGSWPEKELQKAYSADPQSFEFSVEKELDYEDPSEDHSDDLDLLMMEFLQEHPEAKPLRPVRKNR